MDLQRVGQILGLVNELGDMVARRLGQGSPEHLKVQAVEQGVKSLHRDAGGDGTAPAPAAEKKPAAKTKAKKKSSK